MKLFCSTEPVKTDQLAALSTSQKAAKKAEKQRTSSIGT
jgi:hypothetical protein